MSEKIKAFAASEPKGKFEPFEFEAGELGKEEVEIKVAYGGLCHSDLSMLNNEWRLTKYPFVAGHEAVGEITAMGDNVKGLQIGDYLIKETNGMIVAKGNQGKKRKTLKC